MTDVSRQHYLHSPEVITLRMNYAFMNPVVQTSFVSRVAQLGGRVMTAEELAFAILSCELEVRDELRACGIRIKPNDLRHTAALLAESSPREFLAEVFACFRDLLTVAGTLYELTAYV